MMENTLSAKSQRLLQEENNPCLKEHNMSMNCLSEHHYDSEQCQIHFLNYRNCKSFWNEVRRHRRLAGVRPLLPPIQERGPIKKKYLETGTYV